MVHLERLGLASRPVEREHQLSPKALAQRMLFDERLELADQLLCGPQLEVRLDSLLDRRQA